MEVEIKNNGKGHLNSVFRLDGQGTGFDFWYGTRGFLLSTAFRLALHFNQSPIQWA
jgi:hypothetical protein